MEIDSPLQIRTSRSDEDKLGDQKETSSGSSSRLKELEHLIERLSAYVEADGGTLRVLEVNAELGLVKLMLSGACASCALSDDTMESGVEKILKTKLDWLTQIEWVADENIDLEESAKLGKNSYQRKLTS